MSGGLFEFGTHASDMGAMFYVSLPLAKRNVAEHHGNVWGLSGICYITKPLLCQGGRIFAENFIIMRE